MFLRYHERSLRIFEIFHYLQQGLKHSGPRGRFVRPAMLSGIFKYLTFTLPSALKKDAAKQMNQSWMIPSAVLILPIALPPKFHSPAKFWEILGGCQKPLHMFCRLRESIRPSSSWKTLRSVAGVRCWRPPVTGHRCIPAQKFVSVSGELNHDRSLLVLDSDKGVCCHRFFS